MLALLHTDQALSPLRVSALAVLLSGMLFSKFQLYFPIVTYQCPWKVLPASLDPASPGSPPGPAWFPCAISSRVEMRLRLLGPKSHPAWGGHRNRHVPGRPLRGPRPSLWLCLGNYRSLGFRFRVCTSAGRGTLPQVVPVSLSR